ncbi:MAG: hypothetical protein RBR54_05455 [Sulfurimonas sp.]|jgi:hypothetical protein|nr:hypothetical protein [Sulfurimonas sp.]
MDAKQKNIAQFYEARTQYFKWLNSVKLLVSGFEIDKNYLTPIAQDSAFGRWFYTQGLQFSRFQSKNVLDELEEILALMYEVYTKIYAIYYGEKKSALKSLLGIRQVPNKHEQELAARYYEELVLHADRFKKRLSLFESQLLSMSQEKHVTINRIKTDTQQKKEKDHMSEEGGLYHGPRSH